MQKVFNQYILIAVFVALGACASTAGRNPQVPPCDGDTMIETQLFFGMSKPDGGSVSEEDWDAFLQRQIVPHFAEGFAVLETHGFWQDGQSQRTISEPGRMISRLLRPGDAEAIPLIVEAYKQQFHQESVLRIDTTVCAKF